MTSCRRISQNFSDFFNSFLSAGFFFGENLHRGLLVAVLVAVGLSKIVQKLFGPFCGKIEVNRSVGCCGVDDLGPVDPSPGGDLKVVRGRPRRLVGFGLGHDLVPGLDCDQIILAGKIFCRTKS